MSQDLIGFYRIWPCKFHIEDDLRLYKRISKCMMLDNPKWVIDGRPVGCRPFKDSKGRSYKLWRHFEPIEYHDALRSILNSHRGDEVFDELRRREFDSNWRHYTD